MVKDDGIAKATYKGIEISYDEQRNVWEFELRNVERYARTLTAAKEAIDKAPDPEKKFFEPFAAWVPASRWGLGDDLAGDDGKVWVLARITSVKRDRWTSSREFRCSIPNPNPKERPEVSSVRADDIVLDTPKNVEIIQSIEALQNERRGLRKRIEAASKGLTRYNPAKLEEPAV